MALRNRNAVTLFKIESTPGTDAAPVAASDAIATENFRIRPALNTIRTNEDSGSLDDLGPIVAGMQVVINFDLRLKGAAAAGSAPEWGKVMRACGWAETLTASAIPAAPEACAAGGSTTSAVLGASASTTAQLYRGMPIIFTGVVAGTSFISDYTSGKVATLVETMSGSIVATTNYQIPPNALYAPASSGIPAATIYRYVDGKLWKVVGCRGDWSLRVDAGGSGMISFTFTGIAAAVALETDVAVPSSPVYDATRPPVWIGGKMLYNRVAIGLSSYGLAGNNGLAYPPNPNSIDGFEPGEIVGRNMMGTIDPNEVLVATQDFMADVRAGTRRIQHLRMGTASGNRIGITNPLAQGVAKEPGDRGGIAMSGLSFAAVGKDAGAFLCAF